MKRSNKQQKEDNLNIPNVNVFGNPGSYNNTQQMENTLWSLSIVNTPKQHSIGQVIIIIIKLSNSPLNFPRFKSEEDLDMDVFDGFKTSKDLNLFDQLHQIQNEFDTCDHFNQDPDPDNSQTSLSSAFTSDNETGNDLASDEEFTKEFVSKKRVRTKSSVASKEKKIKKCK